jgi:hypothetical protein
MKTKRLFFAVGLATLAAMAGGCALQASVPGASIAIGMPVPFVRRYYPSDRYWAPPYGPRPYRGYYGG